MAASTPSASVSGTLGEAANLAIESIRSQPARSALAIVGVVIGIVTVVLVSSTLVGLRNSVAASALRRAGYDVVELKGSYQAWLDQQAQLTSAAR